jgi:hypothetical protein
MYLEWLPASRGPAYGGLGLHLCEALVNFYILTLLVPAVRAFNFPSSNVVNHALF